MTSLEKQLAQCLKEAIQNLEWVGTPTGFTSKEFLGDLPERAKELMEKAGVTYDDN